MKQVNLKPMQFKIIMILVVLCFSFFMGSYLYNVQASDENGNEPPTFEEELPGDDSPSGDTGNNDNPGTQEEVLEAKSFNNGFSAYNYAENYLASLDKYVIKGTGYMLASLGMIDIEESLNVLSYKISQTECANHIAITGKFNYDLQDFFVGDKVYHRKGKGQEYAEANENEYKININRRKMKQVFEINRNTAVCSGFKNGAKEYSCSFTLLDPSTLGSQVDQIISSFMKIDKATNFKSCTIKIVLNKYGQPKSYTYIMSGIVYAMGLSADINLNYTEHFGYFNKNIDIDLQKFTYIPYSKEA